MKDFRAQSKAPVIGKTVRLAAGMQVNEESVKEMLDRMGVDPTPEMVQEGIGFLSSNGMEFNMTNLYDFLKSKQIMARKDLRSKSAVAVKDLRK